MVVVPDLQIHGLPAQNARLRVQLQLDKWLRIN